MTTTIPTDLIGMSEAAKLLGLTTRTIRRRIADGSITAYRVGPRIIRFSRAELLNMVLVVVPTDDQVG